MGFTIFLSWIEHRLFATVFTLELLFPIAILAILYDVCARTSCAVIGDNLLDHVLAYHQLALNHYQTIVHHKGRIKFSEATKTQRLNKGFFKCYDNSLRETSHAR